MRGVGRRLELVLWVLGCMRTAKLCGAIDSTCCRTPWCAASLDLKVAFNLDSSNVGPKQWVQVGWMLWRWRCVFAVGAPAVWQAITDARLHTVAACFLALPAFYHSFVYN